MTHNRRLTPSAELSYCEICVSFSLINRCGDVVRRELTVTEIHNGRNGEHEGIGGLKSGHKVRYVGCLFGCSCLDMTPEEQMVLHSIMPSGTNAGIECVIEEIGDVLCKAIITKGAWLIAYKDHFEVIL